MLLLSIVEFLKDADAQLLLAINGLHTSFLDSCMHYASKKYFWIPFYLLLLFFVIKKQGKSTWLILVFIALTIALTDQICLHFFKNVFLRYRPCHNSVLAPQLHLVDDCGGMYGFISSHAANTFALSTFLVILLSKQIKWISFLFVWSVLVAYSRIYLGQHYPSDVAVGAVVGVSTAWLVSKLYFYSKDKIAYV
ncbi:MAG: phosphatase PAP2 family protein [Bacteroidetes bacterium]|nr:phosphatase PAP2 family protein [Bacteroidota bacterium]